MTKKYKYMLVIVFVGFSCSCSSPKSEKLNREIAFINENFFSLVDTSVVYSYRSLFASFYDSKIKTRDSLSISVWHELTSMQEHVHYLPKIFIKEKLEQYLPVFEDTILKQNSSKLELNKITNTDLIQLVQRNTRLHSKDLMPGTVGDITFYRVLFDKNNKYATTMVYYWTGPRSAALWVFLFEYQNGKWKKILETDIERS